jgi:hypothetical protein
MFSSPRRVCVNAGGQPVLVGLTFEQALEFETLDALPTRHEERREQAKDARQQRWAELFTNMKARGGSGRSHKRAAARSGYVLMVG